MTSPHIRSSHSRAKWAMSFLMAAALSSLASSQGLAQEVRTGRTAFKLNCAACHGIAGKGDGPAAVFLKRPPGDLTQLARQHGGRFPARTVTDAIDGRDASRAHGTGQMPVWGDRFWVQEGAGAYWDEAAVRRRIRSIVAYIESLQE